MPQYCCVPLCTKFGGHQFPTDKDLSLKWRVAIKRIDPYSKRLWTPRKSDVVCSAHFKDSDFKETLLGARKRLLPKAVPSIFEFRDESESARKSPYTRRHELDSGAINDVQSEVTLGEVYNEIDFTIDGIEPLQKDSGNQCSLIGTLSIESLISDPKRMQYYTSFENYDHFMLFFNCLGPAAYDLKYQCLSLHPKDQLLLTLMKLRQAKEDVELSFMFNVSESTVSKIVICWINFLYFQLKELDLWPSRGVIDEHMPDEFKKNFPSTRVILDATETPIQKPSHVDAQSVTWSTYKHRNTLKTMIGCTPRGTISYISDAYGGSASDRQIIEKSELLDPELHMFKRKDSIMADRGIMVQDLFAAKDVRVNTPTMLKGKTQLEPVDVVKDRRVASKRIHVERVIGLAKRFKILKEDLPSGKLVLGSRIVFVCFSINNFRKSIVNKSA